MYVTIRTAIAPLLCVLSFGTNLAQATCADPSSICLNGGTCRDIDLVTGEWVCDCPVGRAQPDCAELICTEDSQCVGEVNTCTEDNTCNCVENFGERCDQDCAVDTDCPSNPADICIGGSCVTNNCLTCAASEECIANACVTVDPCASCDENQICVENQCVVPNCKTDAECNDPNGKCTVETGLCDCEDGFSGDNCETAADPCASCDENQICVEGECVVPNCEVDADCNAPNGECIVATGLCDCEEGFSGDKCEIAADPCASCDENQICIEGECVVPNCEVDADCNAPNGTCIVATGLCDCEEGFSGDKCEIAADPCASCDENQICVEGECVVPNCNVDADCNSPNGVCIVETGLCDCQPGFSGDKCEVEADPCKGVCTENQDCINGACVDRKPEKITCGTATEDLVVNCRNDQTVNTGVQCCRSDASKCDGLPMCDEELCCKDPPPPSAAPTVSPLPSPIPQDITCGQKDDEGGLRCGSAGVETGKKCCREYGKCNGLPHCTDEFCCIVLPSPKPSPSAPPACEGADDRGKCPEPVDHHISCVTSVWEGHVKCGSDENVLYQEPCCRFSGKCGSLQTCKRSNCCTAESTPLPTPSKKPQPPSYRIKCKDKYGLECYEGYEMEDDKECCRYKYACGSTPYCNKKQCCTLKPEATPKPTLPEDTVGACWCDGVVMNFKCYPTLEAAVAQSVSGDVIYIANEVYVKDPIDFDMDLVFAGVTCQDNRETRARIIADFNSTTLAILNAVNEEEQNVKVQYLAITSNDTNQAAFFHGLGVEEDAGDQKLSLELINVMVYNMTSARPGVGVWMGQSAGLIVDPDCSFLNLTMNTSEPDRYAGGAAIAVKYLPFKARMEIGGVFANNSASYPDASKHSGGGAIWLDWMEGDTIFTAQFLNNTANQGGAVMIQEALGYMIIDGLFEDNVAIDDGYGARAGAIRLWKLQKDCQVIINGTFIENVAQGRGGVIATNIHEEDSLLVFDGVFQSNVATDVGGVWSRWSNDEFAGRVVLNGECTFEGNHALSDFDQSDIYSIAGSRRDKLSEKEWEVRDSRTLSIS